MTQTTLRQRCIILGLGAEAASARDYFNGAASLFVFDDTPEKLAPYAASGCTALSTLDALEAIAADNGASSVWLRAPGMAPGHPALAIAARRHCPVTTYTGFWIARHTANVLATITGTKGKSSVTALTGAIMNAAGLDVRIGGNIGVTPTGPPGAQDWVFETSSYQLHDCPAAAPVHAFTSLHPEHLDWHGDMAAYAGAKTRPYHLDPNCHAVLPQALRGYLDGLPNPVTLSDETVIWQGEHLVVRAGPGPSADAIVPLQAGDAARLQGDPILLHTVQMAGATALACAGLLPDKIATAIADALRAWKGLPLRQEVIGDYGGRLWVNDALATIPQATLAALSRFTDRPVRLILGGKERHQDFTPLSAHLNAHAQIHVYLYADAADRLDAQLQRKATRAPTFQSLLEAAYADSAPGDVMLFSPAGATPELGGNFQTRADWFHRFAQSKASL
jgi:UDP-N-acetylmuramoyl-L-alanine---L-glutamate ligase